jgi:hypothetical protein
LWCTYFYLKVKICCLKLAKEWALVSRDTCLGVSG